VLNEIPVILLKATEALGRIPSAQTISGLTMLINKENTNGRVKGAAARGPRRRSR
jgi:hypothetical protein